MSVLIAMFVLLAILLVFAMRLTNEANEKVNEGNFVEVKDVCPACGHALTEEDTECPGCGLHF
jgi:rubrerythrin